jgi:hypothetical protein
MPRFKLKIENSEFGKEVLYTKKRTLRAIIRSYYNIVEDKKCVIIDPDIENWLDNFLCSFNSFSIGRILAFSLTMRNDFFIPGYFCDLRSELMRKKKGTYFITCEPLDRNLIRVIYLDEEKNINNTNNKKKIKINRKIVDYSFYISSDGKSLTPCKSRRRSPECLSWNHKNLKNIHTVIDHMIDVKLIRYPLNLDNINNKKRNSCISL